MNPTQSTWYYVFENTYVRDDTGKVWRCVQQVPWPTNHGADYALIDARGEERLVSVPYQTEATIMLPTLDEATSLVSSMLGGTVVAS